MSSPVISPHQCIIALVVFVGWTLSSFLCHQCGKLFMDRLVQSAGGYDMGLYQFIAALVLTGMQCLSIVATFNIKSWNKTHYSLILLGSHTLATMAVNYSMAYTEAAITMSIKLTEPVFMCIADVLVFKRGPGLRVVISMPMIILGSLMFCGLSTTNNSVFVGAFLAFFSNIALASRNVTLKKLQGPDSTHPTVCLRQSKVKYVWWLLHIVAVAVIYTIKAKTAIDWTHTSGFLLASCLTHVMYSYISTNLVLKVMDVVSHSVANIFKRLLVVVMLYGLGKRQATPWNFVGLCVTVAGLCLYVYDRHQTTTQHSGVTTSDKKRKYRALTVTVFIVACIVGGSTLMVHYNKGVPGMTYIKEKINAHENFNLSTTETRMNENVADIPPMNSFENPFRTNLLAKTLTQTNQVIEESQRILINLLRNIIGQVPVCYVNGYSTSRKQR